MTRGITGSAFAEAPPYPVNLNLAGRSVLVVGAGNVAHRKTSGLLASGAAVTVVGPRVHHDFEDLRGAYSSDGVPGSLDIEERRYQLGEVAGYMLAITCTDDPEVNAAVHRDGITSGVWVNSADDPENCDFTLASIVRQGDLQLTISTGGRSPALSMWLRRRLEAEFDASWAELLDLLAEIRTDLRASSGTSEVAGWLDALDDDLHELVRAGRLSEARDLLRRHLGMSRRSSDSLVAV